MINIDPGEWRGEESLDSKELLREIRAEGRRTMKDALLKFEKTIKETLSGSRSGRTYTVPNTQVSYVASAPGEAPASMFGNLRNSVGHKGPEDIGGTIRGEVGVGLGQPPEAGDPDPSKTYARRLELGGTDERGIRIDPRPYMGPSAEKVEPEIDQLFRRRLGS